MSEEQKVAETTTVQSTPAIAVAKEKISMKDLLVPLSIVVAGVFVGVGLYMSGGNSPVADGPQLVDTDEPEEVVDTTNKIDPVTEADHIKGSINAPVKFVEYSDFECPFCKRQHETLAGVIDKIGADKVAWVYRQFPLEQLHQKAMPVALASECVAELGGNDAFWTFADGYFEETLTNDRTDIETLIPKLVGETGVNKQAFTPCFESKKHKEAVEADVADAVETGGRGTPWSVIIGPTGKTYPVNGALPANVLEQMIQKALDEA